jgi:hypothetical protein
MTTQFSSYCLPVPMYRTFVSVFICIYVLSSPVFTYNNVPLHIYTFPHRKLDQNIVLKLLPNHSGIHLKHKEDYMKYKTYTAVYLGYHTMHFHSYL